MRTAAKLSLTALTAALLLSAAITTASARNLEFTSQRFRVTWAELEFIETGGFSRGSCEVTLEGSFHSRTIFKAPRALIGAITRANVKTETCEGSRRVNIRSSSLPWHVTYESFIGTLPNIAAVRVLLSRFLFEYISNEGLVCKYGVPADNITLNAALNGERSIIELRPVELSSTAHILEGPIGAFQCGIEVILRSEPGDGRVTVLNSTTLIRVALI